MALTQQISDGVYRVADGIVNWYLVREDGEIALYDAGWPRSWPRVQQALRELGGDGAGAARLSAVVLTHAHPDHLGPRRPVRRRPGGRRRAGQGGGSMMGDTYGAAVRGTRGDLERQRLTGRPPDATRPEHRRTGACGRAAQQR
ncbi:MAG: MBL fold metallo-hydrolase [Solirubrobacteraceae bacterium]